VGYDTNRIGIFGGTFDPPHIAHLIIAVEAVERLALNKVLFIPAFVPPHKSGHVLSSFHDRLDMVRAAIGDNSAFEVSAIEENLASPSYTVQTLSHLRKHFTQDSELYLIIGSDSLRELDSWYEPQRIVSYARLAIYPRPGFDSEPPSWIKADNIIVLESPELPISSTDLRRRRREGRSIRYYVPEPVYTIILRKSLYNVLRIDGPPSSQYEGINGESPLHS